MSLKEKIDHTRIPKHIAIIMDGNGRWAKSQGLKRVTGHKNGTKAVRDTVEACAELGINTLTLFAFSTENWQRPKYEVKTLMELLVSSLKKELPTMMKNNIRLSTIGETTKLPPSVQEKLKDVIQETAHNNRMNLVLALSYGARKEIIQATKSLCKKVANNEMNIDEIDEKIFSKNLYTQSYPDVDLLIRTSGEQRISNFLLWQIAYSELYFTKILWPDFRREHLYEALLNYQNRERRFGKTGEQL